MGEGSKKSKRDSKWFKAKTFELIDRFGKEKKDKEIGPYLEKAAKAIEQTFFEEKIPDAITIPTGDDPEGKNISIHLKQKSLEHRQIDEIQKEAAKSLIRKFSEINATTKSHAQQSGLIRDKVGNSGKYAFLYKNLSPEVEILEVQYSGNGRIFGFFTQEIFNVVCIRTDHVNID